MCKPGDDAGEGKSRDFPQKKEEEKEEEEEVEEKEGGLNGTHSLPNLSLLRAEARARRPHMGTSRCVILSLLHTSNAHTSTQLKKHPSYQTLKGHL